MDRLPKILLLLVFLFLLTAFWSMIGRQKPRSEKKITPQTNEAGNVTVTVTPETLAVGKKPSFQLEFNTHSVDLNFDISQTVFLVDDSGRKYFDSLWEGNPAGGHHRDGVLTFQTLLPKTKYIDLVFLKIAGVLERKFHWEL